MDISFRCFITSRRFMLRDYLPRGREEVGIYTVRPNYFSIVYIYIITAVPTLRKIPTELNRAWSYQHFNELCILQCWRQKINEKKSSLIFPASSTQHYRYRWYKKLGRICARTNRHGWPANRDCIEWNHTKNWVLCEKKNDLTNHCMVVSHGQERVFEWRKNEFKCL